MIRRITISGGHGKAGTPEAVTGVDFGMGDVVSVVGPTGGGKTTILSVTFTAPDGSQQTKSVALKPNGFAQVDFSIP